MHVGHTVTAVVTGKPLDLGGSRGRPEATGRGCMIVTLRSAEAARHRPGRRARGHPGIRQRRRNGGQAHGAGGIQDRRPSSRSMARSTIRTASIFRRFGSTARKPAPFVDFPGSRKHRPSRGHVPGLRRPAARRARERDHLAERRPHPRPHSVRGRQRPHHAGCRRDSAGPTRLRHPGHPGQRRRRHGFLFRMGAGPPGLFWNEHLVNERLEEIMVETLRRRGRTMPRSTASTTASRPTCWRSTAWPSPSSCVESTPEARVAQALLPAAPGLVPAHGVAA